MPVFQSAKSSDLRLRPEPAGIRTNPEQTFTMPDMHGNALKIVHYLIHLGIVDINEEDYNALQTSYYYLDKVEYSEENKAKIKGNLDVFINILTTKTKYKDHQQCPQLRFIGDILGDRGANDWLTLIVLAELKKRHIDFDVIYSNHDLSFINNYKQYKKNPTHVFDDTTLGSGQEHSMVNFGALKNLGLINDKLFIAIFEQVYLPSLQLLDAELIDGKIYIYSHARISPRIINKIIEEVSTGWVSRLNPFSRSTPLDIFHDKSKKTREIFSTIKNAVDEYNAQLQQDPLGFNYKDPIPRLLSWGQRYPSNPGKMFFGSDERVVNVHGHEGNNMVSDKCYMNIDRDNNIGSVGTNKQGEVKPFHTGLLHCVYSEQSDLNPCATAAAKHTQPPAPLAHEAPLPGAVPFSKEDHLAPVVHQEDKTPDQTALGTGKEPPRRPPKL